MIPGVILADVMYAIITLVGVSTLLQQTEVATVMWFATGSILVYEGVRSYLKAHRGHELQAAYGKHAHPLLGGFFINMFSPATIVFWTSMSFTFLSPGGSLESIMKTPAFYVDLGIIIGNIVFLVLLALFLAREKRVFSEGFLVTTSHLLGIILTLFGGYFIIRGIMLTVSFF